MTNFYAPDISDKRISYACDYLISRGYNRVNKPENADFVFLGINPKLEYLNYDLPIIAGNVKASNVYDYTTDEAFQISNAYLTAEGAIAVAVDNSTQSLMNSKVLIIGYGRIGKALHRYLAPYTSDITVCARKEYDRGLALCNGAEAIDFSSLREENGFCFVFNTVPHPVLNKEELRAMNRDVLIIDLASFPGGVDNHFASAMNRKLIVAPGLPGRCSPKSAGIIVARIVEKIISQGEIIQ